MSHRWRTIGLIGLLAALAGSVSADAPSNADEALRRLENLQPAPYERIRQDLLAFYQLTPRRRDQMRQLHLDIQKQDAETRRELRDALARYADWRDHLSDDERGQIDSAPNKTERLAVIRHLREVQWIRTLSLRQRDELARLTGQDRINRIELIRRQEAIQNYKLKWSGPTRFDEYSDEVRLFFDDHIRKRLEPRERKQLLEADGDGPVLAHLLVDLAERYPYLPGIGTHKTGPVRPEQLPFLSGMQTTAFYFEVKQHHVVQEKLAVAARLPPFTATRMLVDFVDPRKLVPGPAHRLQMAHGRWPEYARLLTEVVRSTPRFKSVVVLPLGAARPSDFMAPVQAFIKNDLDRQLSAAEHKQLEALEGRWPGYPELLHKLANQHHLLIPGLSFPLSRDMVEGFADTPDVPANVLRQFAKELTPQELAALDLDEKDPQSITRLRHAYERHMKGNRRPSPQPRGN